MAGLQYYFFPTDFFYPLQKSTNGDSTSKMLLSLQTQEKAESDGGKQARTVMQVDKFSPIKHPSSIALTPIQKKRDGFHNAA